MSADVAPQIGELVGRSLGTRIARYDDRDAILYALAVGAGADDLDLVYERDLTVLPTFALTLGLWAVQAAGRLGAYDANRTLHVGQQLAIDRALPPQGEVEMSARIDAVYDKGRAALLDIVVESEAFRAVYTIYASGAGGFGGPRGDRASDPFPAREPDLRTSIFTGEDQAVLYRLTGDRHPLHVDPEAAVAFGLERPILHGLCTLGAVALNVTRALERPPASLAELAVRFSSPVLPGAVIDVSCWREPADVRFIAAVGDAEALSAGRLRLR
jgi:acyl dehydratase